MTIQRREFLVGCTATGVAAGYSPLRAREYAVSGMGYGFSLYGMKQIPLQDALRTCAEIGYDCVELPTMADWQPRRKNFAEQRTELRSSLTDNQLRLSALMENVTLLANAGQHVKNVARLQAAAEPGHDLSPMETPIIETIMGGSPASWEESKGRMAERLGEWAKAGEQSQTVIAIKAHVAGAAPSARHSGKSGYLIKLIVPGSRPRLISAIFNCEKLP